MTNKLPCLEFTCAGNALVQFPLCVISSRFLAETVSSQHNAARGDGRFDVMAGMLGIEPIYSATKGGRNNNTTTKGSDMASLNLRPLANVTTMHAMYEVASSSGKATTPTSQPPQTYGGDDSNPTALQAPPNPTPAPARLLAATVEEAMELLLHSHKP